MKVFGTKNVSERRLGQESCRVVSVLDVGHRHGRVRHPVVDDGVDGNRHGIFCQHLRKEKLQGQLNSGLT